MGMSYPFSKALIQILYFDYEGHRLKHTNPDHLTPEHIVKDLLTIAVEMNVKRYSYYG